MAWRSSPRRARLRAGRCAPRGGRGWPTSKRHCSIDGGDEGVPDGELGGAARPHEWGARRPPPALAVDNDVEPLTVSARRDGRPLARHARVIERGPRSRRVTRKALLALFVACAAAGLVVLARVRRPRRGSSALWGLFFAVVAAVAAAGERFTRPDAQAVRMTTVQRRAGLRVPDARKVLWPPSLVLTPTGVTMGPRHTAWLEWNEVARVDTGGLHRSRRHFVGTDKFVMARVKR